MSEEMSEPEGEMLLTKDDVARRLRVSVRTVHSLIKAQKLKALRVGSSVRIDPRDLEEFIQKSKTQG